MRLRPSGRAGPVASRLDSFAEYQEREAWTWEHMALTRARVISSSAQFRHKLEQHIRKVLTRPRERRAIASDVAEMRRAIALEKGEDDIWDLKYAAGGMVDIEFIAQYLQLLHADAHPDLLSTETEAVLTRAAKAGLLPAADADILLPALRLYQALTQILRLCVEGPFDPAAAPRGLLALLARAGELPDFPTLDRDVRDTETAVSAAFEQLIGEVPEGAASSKKVAP
jgi:glutamate-ammonia-ligase adenylyltransferase